MKKKYKFLLIGLAAVIVTAAVSAYAALWFAGPKTGFSPSEYKEYLEYKELDGKGQVIRTDDARYLQALTFYYGKVFEVQNIIESNFYKDTADIDFSLAAARAVAEALDDPYSYFLSVEEFERLQESMRSEYVGIGIVVSPAEDGYITVVSPYRDSPAGRAGILPLDRIVAVNGERLSGDQLNRAVELIRGEPGTEVTVTFMRDDIEFDIAFRRETIRVETVFTEVMDEDIGYIAISQFGSNTDEEFHKHLIDLTKQGIKGIVIDLRYNPGGDLDTLLNIADVLLGEQVIISLKNKSGEIERYESDERTRYDDPIVVIVNGGSASASEALTGALADTGRAAVVGTRTFGKGVAQTLYPLSGGYALNLTTAEYFTPNGTNVNETGIEPEYLIDDDPDTEDDEQLDKAIEVIKGLMGSDQN